MLRFLLLALLLPSALPGNELLEYLKQYEGRWVGDYSISSTANRYRESFLVEQRYWLKGEVLHGLAVYEREGSVKSASSKTWVEGDSYITEITRGGSKEVFVGVPRDGGVLWLPKILKRANDYQMHESFQIKQNVVVALQIKGFDTYYHEKGKMHLIYRGILKRHAEAAE